MTVSPYEFGTKSAYPASSRLDITTCRRLNIEVESADAADDLGDSTDLASLAGRLREFKTLERELSMAQRWAQGRITELRDHLETAIDSQHSRLVADLLVGLADGKGSVDALAQETGAPPELIQDVLEDLVAEDLVDHDGDGYHLA